MLLFLINGQLSAAMTQQSARTRQRGRLLQQQVQVIYFSDLAADHLFLLAVGSGNGIKARSERRRWLAEAVVGPRLASALMGMNTLRVS